MRVLSTKKLSESQKDLLLQAGCSLVQYDAITISFLDFDIPENAANAIFTSQNSVRAFFEKKHPEKAKTNFFKKAYCVGEKTSQLLEENGQKVSFCAKNSSELSDFILKSTKKDTFYYFCGSRRRDELPEKLKKGKMTLFEVKTYQTDLNPVNFDSIFDGILFFSPSGVQSFCSVNRIETAIAFCIGETTASEAKKHTNKIEIANCTTIESTIAKTVKILKNYD